MHKLFVNREVIREISKDFFLFLFLCGALQIKWRLKPLIQRKTVPCTSKCTYSHVIQTQDLVNGSPILGQSPGQLPPGQLSADNNPLRTSVPRMTTPPPLDNCTRRTIIPNAFPLWGNLPPDNCYPIPDQLTLTGDSCPEGVVDPRGSCIGGEDCPMGDYRRQLS